MPARFLRSVEAGDTAVVYVHVVREPDQDSNLPRAPSQRGLNYDAASLPPFRDFLADESGATAIEYGLIAARISLAIIAIVNRLGTKLNTKFTSINTSLK
jgi:pilus assembly protein Flp/PilA